MLYFFVHKPQEKSIKIPRHAEQNHLNKWRFCLRVFSDNGVSGYYSINFGAIKEENGMLVEIRKLNKRETIVVSSRDVAETFDKEHHEVIYAIEGRISENAKDIKIKNKGIINELIEAGNSHIESYFIQSEYEIRGKKYKQYLMTRDGFVLLVMGFSGEKAMKCKLAYINQFNQMESILKGKLIEREKGIVVRQAFTKALQESNENERMHGHAYSTYTNVIYKSAFGKDARQLREEYGISKKDNLRDCLSEEELKQVQNAEMMVSGLIGYGCGYNEIKDFMTNRSTNKLLYDNE